MTNTPAQPTSPPTLAVLISGSGSTMLNLAQHITEGKLNARISIVLASRPDATGLQRAQALNIPTAVVNRKEHDSPQSFSAAVWQTLRPHKPDLIILAGFLSLLIIPEDFTNRVLNIHPALLPKFGGKGMYGKHVHQAVINAGESQSGCTVHYADNQYDHGQTILQRTCPVLPTDTPDTLAQRVIEQERIAYPQAIQQILQSIADSNNQMSP